MRPVSAVAFLCLGLVLLAPTARATAAPHPFVNEVVDPSGPNGECNWLAVDAWGRPHVAYNDGGANSLKYAVKIGGRWQIETVPGTEGLMGDEVAIDVDSKGEPHILWWIHGTQDDVGYATKRNGAWVLETVATTGTLGQNLAVAVDRFDRVHAVFSENPGSANKLWYALRDGSWGAAEPIDSNLGTFAGYCGVTTDAEGRPHVAYQGKITGNNAGLRYAVRNPGWTTVEADPTANAATICSIALDPMGRPHISHWASIAQDLRHAWLQDGVWQYEIVDGTSTATGAENSIAVDAQGGIHISYFDLGTASNLRYAFNDGTGWVKQTVDETGVVGCYTNIDLDPEGNPHIIHYDNTNQVLKYATSAVRIISPFGGEVWAGGAQHEVVWEGPGPVDIELSTDGGFTYEPLATGIQSHRFPVTIPRVSTTAARIRVVRQTPFRSSSSSPSPFSIAPDVVAPWWNAAVDTSGQTGSGCVLALDAYDNPRIVFNGPGGLRFAAKSGDRWYFDTITSSGLNPSFKLQSDGTPHVSYGTGGSSKDLYYATRSTTGGWTTQPIETTNDVGLNSSIAVSRDSIEVAFLDNTNKDLRFATKVIGGSTWHSVRVDGASSNAGFNPALVLDRDANPHIVYRDATNSQFRHAWLTTNGWLTETVFTGASGTGQSPSLAIDDRGVLHASFVVSSGESLYYATKESDSWRVELADAGEIGQGTVGQTSIAVDGDGRPHISYMKDGYELNHAVRLNGGWVIETVSEPPVDPAVTTSYDAQYNSLAIDSQGAARIAYSRYRLTFNPSLVIDTDLRYASSAIELLLPAHGSSWPVGARRDITWDGTGPADVFLSTDGGFSYSQLASDVRGGEYRLTVPAQTSTQCKVKIERAVPHSVSVTDSFFTIQSTVALLAYAVAPPADGSTGVQLQWATEPGLPDLSGYRIDRRVAGGAWTKMVSPLQASSWIDRDGKPGSSYRLTAINGLGEELLLGEVGYGPSVPLAAWPVPLMKGPLTITFATYGGLGGGEGEALVEIYDLGGRRVRTITRGAFEAGMQQVSWDGADAQGTRVSPGIYFVRAESAGSARTLKVVVAR